MKTLNVPARSLREHPAQMRTEMDPEEMARLVLQVYERGLDAHQPIVVAANGDGTYRVVSGHRRWLAALLAQEVKVRAGGKADGVDLDFARQVVCEFAARPAEVTVCASCGEPLEIVRDTEEEWCPRCASWVEMRVEMRDRPSASVLPGLYVPLAERHGDLEIPVALFEGSEKEPVLSLSKEEILLLQAANFGQEAPDLLGQARSYAAALKAGATAGEIAAHTGQPVSRVETVLALSRVPEPLARAVAAGEIALGVTAAVARLRKGAQREGLAHYVLEQDVTVEEAQRLATALHKWKPPAVSLDPETTPPARNQARLVGALWAEVHAADPARAWYAAAWAIGSRKASLLAWSHWLGAEESERDLLFRLVPEAHCENCCLRELLQVAPLFSYPCYPCQRTDEAGACFQAICGQDPFYLQVPFEWEGYPGVERAGGGSGVPVCRSPEGFRQTLATATAGDDGGEGASGRDADPVAPARAEGMVPGVAGVDNVAAQRALIGSYMAHHAEASGARHPLATRCEDCRYRLAGSPTKDPTVPPCQ